MCLTCPFGEDVPRALIVGVPYKSSLVTLRESIPKYTNNSITVHLTTGLHRVTEKEHLKKHLMLNTCKTVALTTEAQPPSFIQVGDSHMIKVLGHIESHKWLGRETKLHRVLRTSIC